jgi:hypothetical protein
MTHKTAALQQTVGLFDLQLSTDDLQLFTDNEEFLNIFFLDPNYQLLELGRHPINKQVENVFENPPFEHPLGEGNEGIRAVSAPYVQSPIPPSTSQNQTCQTGYLRSRRIVNYNDSTSENETRTRRQKSYRDREIIFSRLAFTKDEDTWIKKAGDQKTTETWKNIADEYNLAFPEDPRKPKQLRERYENHLNDAYSHKTISNEVIRRILPEIKAATDRGETINWSTLAKTIELEDGKNPTANALKNKYNAMYSERRR